MRRFQTAYQRVTAAGGGPDGHSVDNSARDDRDCVDIRIFDLESTNGSFCHGVRHDARSDAEYRPDSDGALLSQDSQSEAARRLCSKRQSVTR
jgi:hypothetical protein